MSFHPTSPFSSSPTSSSSSTLSNTLRTKKQKRRVLNRRRLQQQDPQLFIEQRDKSINDYGSNSAKDVDRIRASATTDTLAQQQHYEVLQDHLDQAVLQQQQHQQHQQAYPSSTIPTTFASIPPVRQYRYPPDFPTHEPQSFFPTGTFTPTILPSPSDDEDVTWLLVIILTAAIIISFASVIRSCGQKAGWITGSSASSSSSPPSGLSSSDGFGGRRGGGSGRGRGFGRHGYSGTGPHHVPDWEVDPGETEERLNAMTETERQAFDAAKAYPPNSVPTEISLSQYLSIQEKGVSAWEFEASYDHQLFVHDRTEISFFDQVACVQTNLPLPKQQEVYYWEVKMFEKSPNATVAVGVATKPYPAMRLPGWNRHSVGYFSNTGMKSCNSPWNSHFYGPPYYEGDVIGCGYRPRNGTIFYTRNGKRIEDAYTGFGRTNLFPTVGATGPCVLHVNFGQSGFVFVEANVKKWGLAPASGSLAPPPAYGSELGSILLEASVPSTIPPSAPSGQRRTRTQPQQQQQHQISTSSNSTARGRPILQSGTRAQTTGGLQSEARTSSSPVQISLGNMSAPPPNYSSLDRYGNLSQIKAQTEDETQSHGRGNANAEEGVAEEDDMDDTASVSSSGSDESVTLLLGQARPESEQR
ncbi:Rsp5p-dependent ubiquitination, sorting of cargo proteins at the multivesicular body [Haplosporangium sp. Z 11]|nr:Rsp5p-dependent ubiquitination, sorting of cargo proteins at the multivesicular body [Haplosporangium sp. Z 11]